MGEFDVMSISTHVGIRTDNQGIFGEFFEEAFGCVAVHVEVQRIGR